MICFDRTRQLQQVSNSIETNYPNLYSILGKFCCLFCHIQKDQLKIPVDVRGRLEKRTLSTLDKDLDHMTHTYNGDTKKAKLCNNVIGKRVFNVPIDQV